MLFSTGAHLESDKIAVAKGGIRKGAASKHAILTQPLLKDYELFLFLFYSLDIGSNDG